MAFLKELAPYGEAIFVICQLLVAAVMLYLTAKFASKKDVNVAQARADNAHHRIDLLEKDVQGLPDYEKFNKLTAEVSEMNAELRALTATVRSLDEKADIRSASISRIEDHLLNHAK